MVSDPSKLVSVNKHGIKSTNLTKFCLCVSRFELWRNNMKLKTLKRLHLSLNWSIHDFWGFKTFWHKIYFLWFTHFDGAQFDIRSCLGLSQFGVKLSHSWSLSWIPFTCILNISKSKLFPTWPLWCPKRHQNVFWHLTLCMWLSLYRRSHPQKFQEF